MRLGIGSVVGLLLLVGCGHDAGAPDQRSGADSSVRATLSDWVIYTGPESLDRDAVGRATPGASMVLATELVEQHGDHLLGAYVKGTTVVIVAGDQAGVAIAERAVASQPDIAVEQAAVTLDRTADVGAEVRKLSPTWDQNIFMTGPAPDIGGIFVGVADEPSRDDRILLEEYAAAQRVPIRVEVVGSSLSFLVE